MGKVRRGNYVFISWAGDHSPRHIHVYRNEQLVVKWDLENQRPMIGEANCRLIKIIEQLDQEGQL